MMSTLRLFVYITFITCLYSAPLGAQPSIIDSERMNHIQESLSAEEIEFEDMADGQKTSGAEVATGAGESETANVDRREAAPEIWEQPDPLSIEIMQAVRSGEPAALSAALSKSDCLPRCTEQLSKLPVLEYSIRTKDGAMLAELLAVGADPDHRSWPDGWTPLMFALRELDEDAVRLLLKNGADTDLVALDGTTAHELARIGQMTGLIPAQKLNLTHRQANLLLLQAAEIGSVEIAQQALEATASPLTASAANEWTVAMVAAYHGKWEVIDLLGKWTADSNLFPFDAKVGDKEITVYHAALIGLSAPERENELDCVLRSLINAGAPISAWDEERLRFTAENLKSLRVFDRVIPASEGLEVCARNADGEIALVREGQGSDKNLPNTSGVNTTPSQKAAGSGLEGGEVYSGQSGGSPFTLRKVGPRESPEDVAQKAVYFTKTNLNLRDGPSSSNRVLSVLSRGLEVSSDEGLSPGKWIRVVTMSGDLGYVNSDYLSTIRPAKKMCVAIAYSIDAGDNILKGFEGRGPDAEAALEDATVKCISTDGNTCIHGASSCN